MGGGMWLPQDHTSLVPRHAGWALGFFSASLFLSSGAMPGQPKTFQGPQGLRPGCHQALVVFPGSKRF